MKMSLLIEKKTEQEFAFFLAYIIVCQHSHIKLEVWRLVIPNISNEILANPLQYFSYIVWYRGIEFRTVPYPSGSTKSKFCLQKAQELFRMVQLTQGLSVTFVKQTATFSPIFFHSSCFSTHYYSYWHNLGFLLLQVLLTPPSVCQCQNYSDSCHFQVTMVVILPGTLTADLSRILEH